MCAPCLLDDNISDAGQLGGYFKGDVNSNVNRDLRVELVFW